MARRRIGGIVTCALLTAPAAAAAQEEPAAPEPAGPSASLSVVVTNAYFFRGIVQETDGVVVQPSLESGFTLYEGAGALTSVGLSLGLWSSLHTEHQANESAPAAWYEADLYAGMSFGFAEVLSVGVTYTAYTSPNGSFATVHELAGSVGFDDAGLWEDLGAGRFGGIQPSVTVARELGGTAFGPSEGTYLEVGVGPGLSLVDGDDLALGVSLPVTVGASLGDYYEDADGDDAFGYVNAGLSVTAGLGFVPERYGGWELSLGGSALVLGDRLEAANGGSGAELLVAAGLAVGY